MIREVVFASRPRGSPSALNFALREVALAEPQAGEVRVRNLWMAVDPCLRTRMRDELDFLVPAQVGAVLDGYAVGEVECSRDARFEKGDVVLSRRGWREAFNALPQELELLDTVAFPAQAYLGVAGMPGYAAYLGITKVLDVQPGQTVFISAAAGAVGSIACQIAKLRGATVVGSAGGPVKGAFLRRIGVDRVIDYKATPDFTASLRQAAPLGIDGCLDCVGSTQLSAALAVAKPGATIALCGVMSAANGPHPNPDMHSVDMLNIIGKQLTLKGYSTRASMESLPYFLRDMKGWIERDGLVWQQHVVHGIEKAPEAFLRLFDGSNLGKMLVRLDDGSSTVHPTAQRGHRVFPDG